MKLHAFSVRPFKSQAMEKLLATLKEKKINIRVDDRNDLKLEVPKGIDITGMVAEIKANKQALIDYINERKSRSEGSFPIRKAPDKSYYVLSSAQQRMYYQYELDKSSLAYNISAVVELEGEVDRDRVEATFKKLIKRHESLRTRIVLVEGEPFQQVLDEAAFSVKYFEIQRSNADAWIKASIQPFDVSKSPLIRADLAKLSDQSHLLLVDIHHIINDGVSQAIIIKDFMSLYNGDQLAPLSIQYKDYAEWQQSTEQQARLAHQQKFWQQQFAEEVSLLNLPADYPRPQVKSYEGNSTSFVLGREETQKISQLGERMGATMFMTVLSLFNVLLSKLSGQEDVTVGTQVTGRDHADVEKVMGVFINALAIRNYPAGQRSFADFLEEVKLKVLSCFAHQSYPFEELIRELKVERGTDRHPLFDVMFMYENADADEEFTIPGLSLKSFQHTNKVTKFDLTLTAREIGGELLLSFEYSTELFRADTIDRFVTYFQNIVSEVVSNPDKKLSQIDVLPEAERRKIVHEFNDTAQQYPREMTIVGLFEDQVRAHPDTPAVIHHGQSLTYRELNERANQLARYLLSCDVTLGSVVGLLLDRSPEMIVAIMGVLKAGAGYLPIDPSLPEQRIEYMLDQSRVTLLLAHQAYLERHAAYLTVKDINAPELYAEKLENAEVDIRATDLAYCIFTSGSTGLPKGVAMPHRGVVNLMQGLAERVYRDCSEAPLRVALLASYAFDASMQQIAGALLQGHSLYIADELDRQDGRRLLAFYNCNKIDVSDGTPTHLRLLVDALDKGGALKTLDHWILAGELLPKALVRQFYKHQQHRVQLHNFYGPTEACVDSTGYRIDPETLDNYATLPIGKPLPNERIYITDAYGNVVPIGVTGELCIAGDGLAQQYVGAAELTAEKFPKHWVKNERRVYRTGDLARWLSDGNIEYKGRIDHQVKIRGYRVEVAEIERQLLAYSAVRNAVVLLKEVKKEICLVGYYVSDAALDVSELRSHVAEVLPEYMIPSYFVHLEELPVTVSGKVNKGALPAVDVGPVNKHVAPSNAVEEKLVEIWSEVLKRDQDSISTTSRFFELGGHSLRLVFLANKIKQSFQVEFTLAQLIEHQTVTSLATALQQAKQSQHTSLEKAPEKPYYSLSPVQERLYFLYEFDQGSLAYNMPQVLKLEGKVDRGRVEASFRALIQRHEILRTAIVMQDEKPVQQIRDQVPFSVEYIEPVDADVDAAIQSIIQPFDLSRAPLLRVGLIRQSAASHLMIVDLHHIVSDGVSQGILIKDFMALYESEPLPEPTFQYKDFAEWQQAEPQQALLEAQRGFWKQEFTEPAGVLDLPTDCVRPKAKSFRGDHLSLVLTKEETQQLKAVGEEGGATLFMTLLSVFNVLLSKLSHQQDITVGTPVAGREHVDLESIVGMFVNTIAVRSYLRDEASFREFLAEVKERTLACFEHQSFPYEQLVEELSITRDSSRNPLFDVMFIFQNTEQEVLRIPGLTLAPYKEAHRAAMFDLTLIAEEAEGELHLSFNYATDLFERSTIERFTAYFRRIVSIVTGGTEVKLSEIDVLSEQERHELLYAFNDTAVDYPQDESVIDVWEKQVAQTPEKVAVYDATASVTYHELNARANQLARYLIQQTIGVGDVVGVMMPRSVDYIVSVLAVVKSGATYVPVDAAYPNDRISYMLSNSRAKALLSQEDTLAKKAVEADCPVYAYDPCQACIREQDTTNLSQPMAEDIYVMYTSGSTGLPKGVRGSQTGLMNRLRWGWQQYPIDEHETFCFKTNVSFVDHVVEMFSPLLAGVTLRIFDDTELLDIEKTYSLLVKERITRITVVPTYLNSLLELKSEEESTRHSLKYVFCSGEYLPFELAKRFYREFSDATLVNIYGSTEVSADATYYQVERYHVEDVLKYFKKYSYTTNDLFTHQATHDSLEEHNITVPNVKLEQVAANFKETRVSEYPTSIEDYFTNFQKNVLPYSVNTASPRFIGHMTSVLPDYVHDISKLISQLNQNLVKIETSKSFTFLEREAIAMLHRIFYDFSEEFYRQHVQQLNANLGIITSGGSTANMSAMLSARNKLLYGQCEANADESIYQRLRSQGYEDMVVIGSRLMHYSFRKAASLLGLGRKNIVYVENDADGTLNLNDLRNKIKECRERNVLIIGIVGIAGATETGSIDPLAAMATVAREHGIHFHVDAAWGGLLKFSDQYAHLIDGIAQADSITFCGHKQLFLPQGISICLFKDPYQLNHNSTEANYQASAASFDFGRVTLEGSKPGLSLCLHASLKILGKKGYELLLERGINLAQRLAAQIKATDGLELISNHMNIVNYRYIPLAYRHKTHLTEAENEAINEVNTRLQERQFLKGETFVSKTKIERDHPTAVFRAVLSNPLTTYQDLEYVLKDQLTIVREVCGEENTIGTVPEDTYQPIVHGPQHEIRKIPIGRPIANTKILILDRNKKLQPVGVPGELCVAGQAVAHGYLGNPDLTREQFTANPYAEDERLYCTGDLARWRADGSIEFMGRLDSQVKIRGNRVELGEVESQLLSHEEIDEAVATAQSQGSDYCLVGYYVAAQELDIRELKGHLATRLPDYMIPTYFVRLESLPLLPNGKVNRKNLPEPMLRAGEGHVGARNETEEQLVTIWSEVLKLPTDAISVRTSFFDLGGQSIRALQLISKIQKVCSVKLALREIFAKNTIEEMAELVRDAELVSEVSLPKAGTRAFYPTSPAQERMYYSHLLRPDSLERNIHDAIELGEGVDVAQLAHAFNALVNRHSVLRTYFELASEGVVQKIAPSVDFALEPIVCSAQEELSEAFRRFITPFDLSQAPLIRGAIVHGLDRNYLFIDIHHIVCDGTSINLLLSDLRDLYEGRTLASVERDYTDFAVWVREKMDAQDIHKDFWVKKLSGLTRLNLPIAQDRRNELASAWSATTFRVEEEQYHEVKAFTEEAEVSDFMFFLAVYYIVLHKVTGDEDIVVGSDAQGRFSKQLQEVVGTFTNILPLRMPVDTHQPFAEFLAEVKECVLAAVEHQDYPYDQMVSIISAENEPLVDVHFAFSNAVNSTQELEDLQFKSVDLLKRTTGEYELQIEVFEEKDSRFHVSLIYNTALYDEYTMDVFEDMYQRILRAVLKNRRLEIDAIAMGSAVNDPYVLS